MDGMIFRLDIMHQSCTSITIVLAQVSEPVKPPTNPRPGPVKNPYPSRGMGFAGVWVQVSPGIPQGYPLQSLLTVPQVGGLRWRE